MGRPGPCRILIVIYCNGSISGRLTEGNGVLKNR